MTETEQMAVTTAQGVDGGKVEILGHATIDGDHQVLAELIAQIAPERGEPFAAKFAELHRLLNEHFARELQLMETSGYPARGEHHADHQRIAGQIDQFASKVAGGNTMLARAFVTDSLPQWFHTHIITMDSALALHLKQTAIE